jgi:hypothetical protein
LSFDGSGDGVILPRNPDYGTVGTQFTIEAWVRPTTTAASYTTYIYVRRGNFADYAISWFSGQFRFGVSTDDNRELVLTGSSSVNIWHHVAGVVDGRSVSLFIDGIRVGLATAPANITWRPDDARCLSYSEYATFIGHSRSPGDGGAPTVTRFVGDIDEVRVSRSARYSSNFTAPYAIASDATTVGLWRFDEATGVVAVDSSPGGALSGTIEGATRRIGR